MYNGIGVPTPRGTGTTGYCQTNKFFVRPKAEKIITGSGSGQEIAAVNRKPNKEMLEHDRKREIEVKLVVLEDKLMDLGYSDAEVAEKVEEARNALNVQLRNSL